MEPNIFVYALRFQAILQQQTICAGPWGQGWGGDWQEDGAIYAPGMEASGAWPPASPRPEALPVTRLAGAGIQKMLLPVLQMRAGGKS